MSASSDIGLALETACEEGGCAVGRGDAVLAVRAMQGQRRYASLLVPAIGDICREAGVSPADISLIFVSHGPGSFTGLRLGITIARMLALGRDAQVVPVPTLEVVAQNALALSPRPSRVAVILDAKRNNVYAARFELTGDRYVARSEPIEASPAGFLADQPAGCAVLGDGVPHHRAVVEASRLLVAPADMFAARPEVVYRLGRDRLRQGLTVPARDLVPHYVRLPESEERWAARQTARGARS